MTALDRILTHGLSLTLRSVERIRQRVYSLARRYRGMAPTLQLARIRQEIARTEPDIARALEGGILAAWVQAAREPAKELPRNATDDASDDGGRAGGLASIPPGPPFGPLSLVPPSPEDEPDTQVRWPAIEAAARDLLSRRAVTHDTFVELGDDARRASFTLAGDLTADTIDAVKDAVTHDILHGGTLKEFKALVGKALDSAGLSAGEVETVYRTNTGIARSAGLRKVLDHPLVADEFPYQRYVCIHDGRVRPNHKALEHLGIQGTDIYRCDDPVARKYFPPWDFNCRCAAIPLTLESAAEAGIREARVWLTTGEPPAMPAFVPDPLFKLPSDWPVSDGRVHPVI